MRERPILFSGEMARAILSGRKTMTRRVIKPQPTNMDNPMRRLSVISDCPYGKIGDRLWVRETFAELEMDNGSPFAYRADGDKIGCHHWKPSIFMRRRASRILLEIINIRVERLQDISTEDIIKEGLSTNLREHDAVCDLKEKWQTLWDKINGKKHPLADNPWVWVIEFKRVAL